MTNATVTVRDVAKGLERAASNDGQGGYSVRQLAPGNYSVTVDVSGFAKSEAAKLPSRSAGWRSCPSRSASPPARKSSKSAPRPIVETSRSSTTNTIGERRIDNLPINGRNYINFTLTDSQVQR